MTLFDVVIKAGIDSISIVGMAKNAGKTLTLNYLIQKALQRNILLGLTSTGRDGELQDIVYYTHKPPIWVPKSALVATAWDCVNQSGAKIEIMEKTHFSTPLGEIIIGKVRESGNIELVGPRTGVQLKQLIKHLKQLGARLVMVDGAVNRVSSAAPALTQGTILATGAALGHSIRTVVEKTALQVEFFRLKRTREDLRNLAKPLIDMGRTGVIQEGKIRELKLETALMAGKQVAESITPETEAVVIGGAVSNKIIEDLTKTIPVEGVEIIVKDGTRLFLEPMVYKRFKAGKGSITAVYPINLLAVTVNPTSPEGYSFSPREFLSKIKKALFPIPVYDVVLGEGGVDEGDVCGIHE